MMLPFTYKALPVSRPALALRVVPILAFFDAGGQLNALTERRRADHGGYTTGAKESLEADCAITTYRIR